MMEQLIELCNRTDELVQRISETESEELVQLLQDREMIIQQLTVIGNLSDHHKSLLRMMVKDDDILRNRMEQIMVESTEGLQKINQSRLQRRSYQNAYASQAYFIDKRE